MKRILFATSEAVPFIKTGGLADVAGALPKYFDKRYFDIRVILPKYACMKQEWKDKMEYVTHFYMDLGYKNCYVGIMQMQYDGIQFYFIDNEYYFSGPKPYDSVPWDLEKFAFCLLYTSHNPEIAQMADRIIRIEDGRIAEQ